MTDQRLVQRMRAEEGVSRTTAPMMIDGLTLEEFMTEARKNARETPEGRGILDNSRRAAIAARRSQLEEEERIRANREAIAARREQLKTEAAAQAEEDQVVQPNAAADPNVYANPYGFGRVEMFFDTLVGGADVAKTLGVGALGEITAGIAGAGRLIGGSVLHGLEAAANPTIEFDFHKEMMDTADMMNTISEGFAVVGGPWTDSGAKALETVAAPIMKVDNAARDVASWAGMGNPVASTFLYTILMGGLEVGGLGKLRHARGIRTHAAGTKFLTTNQKRSTTVGTVGSQAKARRNQVQTYAKEMGIKLKQTELADDVVRVASKRSTHRAANADDLRDALVAAQRHSKAERKVAVAHATETYAAVKAGDAVALGKSIERALVSGAATDLKAMPKVAAALQDLQNIQKVSPLTGPRGSSGGPVNIIDKMTDQGNKRVRVDSNEAPKLVLPRQLQDQLDAEQVAKAAETAVGLDELWTIRNRLENARIAPAAAEKLQDTVNPNIAINKIQKDIDEFLNYKYDKNMMLGDKEALAAWRLTDKALAKHNAMFNEDKAIFNMMQEGATAHQVRNWLVGASVTSPSPKAVSTLRKLKKILGKDSKEIQGIRADYVHEMVQPLMATPPNFKKFIKDFDNLMVNQKPLMKELGINDTDLKQLRGFAELAKDLPVKHPFISKDFLAAAMARFGVGHGIAKAGMKVSITRRILGNMIGVDLATQKKILQHATGTMFDQPIIPTSSAAGIFVTESAILADLRRVEEQAKARLARSAARK